MKILLTGANGFVGSHILDTLHSRNLETAVLLRPGSNRQFIEHLLPWAEARIASFTSPESLQPALDGITHIIHCAGVVRARNRAGFSEGNELATARLMEALSRKTAARVIYISSLAAAGPGTPDRPRRESDPEEPVSDYGGSKLAAERELRAKCPCEFVVLRPSAVYGPRDREFLKLFRSVKRHVRPLSNQPLSLVYVKDLARVTVECLTHPAAAGQTFFVANPQVVTVREMGEQLASELNTRAFPIPLPSPFLYLLCLFSEVHSRVFSKPSVLGLQKFAELRAPGWVCDPGRLQTELGLSSGTDFREGARQTLEWYREQRWL